MRIAENLNAFNEAKDSYDCINISVDGSPDSNLDFTNLLDKIDQIQNKEKKVCIELFLDLHNPQFSFTNPIEFATRKRALEVLLQTIETLPEDSISHIILYRGPIDFSNQIKQNASLNSEYQLWKTDLPENTISEEHLLHVFSAKVLSDFFHSLAAILPDHIRAALLFTLPHRLKIGEIAELISEETFAHLDVGINNPPFFIEGICWGLGSGIHTLSFTPSKSLDEDDVKTAVILPFFSQCNYDRFETICTYLKNQNIPFKVIEENLLNEKWFDIDTVIFDHDSTTFDGKRMIDGFIAAGGKAFVFDPNKTYERENVASDFGYLSFESFCSQK